MRLSLRQHIIIGTKNHDSCFRLINLSFYSNPSGSKKLFELSHEPHLPMTIPLIFLGFVTSIEVKLQTQC